MGEALAAILDGHARDILARWRGHVLFTARHGLAQRAVTIGEGYMPLLSATTEEDIAAKGLRRARADDAPPPPPRHVSALERVAQERLLLLLGPQGAGKTSFALHLALHLAGERVGDAQFNRGFLARLVPRNDQNEVSLETWTDRAIAPVWLPIAAGISSLADLVERATPGLPAALESVGAGASDAEIILIVDGIEMLGARGALILGELAAFAERSARLRALVCGATRPCRDWPLPKGFKRERLVPLLRPQRVGGENLIGDVLPARLTRVFAGIEEDLPSSDGALRMLRADPDRASDVFDRLARVHHRRHEMTGALLSCRGDAQLHAAIVAARFVGDDSSSRAAIVKILAEALAARGLGLSWREEAGRHLARLGDPRDLLATVEVPAGRFTMGAADHPNNAPPHELDLPAFRIARFPIVNRIYRDFVAATGRFWRSTDGLLAERANAPAVDLTWHDAREFCRWLTTRWQASGHIASDEIVRLPSEPEWEKAARSGDARRYPWGADWAHDHQNGEEAGLNTTCAVGLFPSGASPYGAEDMTGQVWEWTTTLWGEDMTTPSFAYPYRADDGREDRESPAAMRRVLRGGAFSSPAFKACTTYRGSLEPAGFWRGNGFRFVVARHGRG